LVGVAIALVAKHPAVRRVEFAGSRSSGTHEELSDRDFAVETSDFAAVARDLPSSVVPLDPLAEQWVPMGTFPCTRCFCAARRRSNACSWRKERQARVEHDLVGRRTDVVARTGLAAIEHVAGGRS
jgi:hypothetical protein